MKKFFVLCCTLCLVLSLTDVNACAEETTTSSEIQNDDMIYYVDSTITYNEIPSVEDISGAYSVTATSTTKQVSASKRTNYRNSSGTIMWYVSISATFKYNGKTSWCTSCTPSAKSNSSAWTISSCTSTKSGSKATATAVAIYSNLLMKNSYTKSISVQCSKTGAIS